MSLLKTEPFAKVGSMDELMAIAYFMEQEAIDGYSELADRMRREHKPELVEVFERLIAEERQHLGNVMHWSEQMRGHEPDLAHLRWKPENTFDDEGERAIAPELLSAYRAFSMAVRNEERAFLFWTYVAAQTDQPGLREAAERMAHEELGHLAALRRERRLAFHSEREARPAPQMLDLPELELRLARCLDDAAGDLPAVDAERFRTLAQEARERSALVSRQPFGPSPLLSGGVSTAVSDRPAPLCELLLDCYLDFGERSPDEESRNRAQQLAAGAVDCMSTILSLKKNDQKKI